MTADLTLGVLEREGCPLHYWVGGPKGRPLVVLTAGKYWAPDGFEKEAAEYHEIWVHQLQASLVHLSTRGRQVIVNAEHDMAESQDSIIIAVHQVVDEVRTNNMADVRAEAVKSVK